MLSGESGDFDAIILSIDPLSKIRMSDNGKRPANPYPDEKTFDEALEMNYYPGKKLC